MRENIRLLGFIGGSLLLCVTAFPTAAPGQNNPMPLLNQPLMPTTATPGGPSFTLTVNGTGFVSGSTVQWNGVALATQFVSASQLTATVPASDIAAPGTASVTASSPSPGGGISNPEFVSVAALRPAIAQAQVFSNLGGSDSVAVADFNGDGKPDVAVNDQLGNTVAVSLGNGDGTFQPYKSYATGIRPYFLATADLNHDGKTDLVVTNTGQNTV